MCRMREARPETTACYMIPITWNFRKCKFIHSDKKQSSSCLGMGGRIAKGHKECFREWYICSVSWQWWWFQGYKHMSNSIKLYTWKYVLSTVHQHDFNKVMKGKERNGFPDSTKSQPPRGTRAGTHNSKHWLWLCHYVTLLCIVTLQ